MSTLGHRTLLRAFEVAGGEIYVDLSAELVSTARLSAVRPIPFVRGNGNIWPVDPDAFPGNHLVPGGRFDSTSDVTGALDRTQLWIFMRERSSLAEVWIPADVVIEDMPDYGKPWSRMVTVRFGAQAAWDLPTVIAVRPRRSTWDMYTVLYTLGSRSFAPLGAHRDRAAVDQALKVSFLPASQTRLEPMLTGLTPRLALRIEDLPG